MRKLLKLQLHMRIDKMCYTSGGGKRNKVLLGTKTNFSRYLRSWGCELVSLNM